MEAIKIVDISHISLVRIGTISVREWASASSWGPREKFFQFFLDIKIPFTSNIQSWQGQIFHLFLLRKLPLYILNLQQKAHADSWRWMSQFHKSLFNRVLQWIYVCNWSFCIVTKLLSSSTKWFCFWKMKRISFVPSLLPCINRQPTNDIHHNHSTIN